MLDDHLYMLSHPTRRRLLVALERSAPRPDGLASDGRPTDHDTRQEPAVVHLPVLDRSGYVTWDRDAHKVIRGPRFEEVRPLLRLLIEHATDEERWVGEPDSPSPSARARPEQWAASVLSHDLRGPLQVLRGLLELAEETGDPTYFERCRDTLERMETLVGDVLALTRAGEAVEDPAPLDLGSLATRAWQTTTTADAVLNVETTRTARADESRLRQLLENLFRNAVEHGGDAVTVTVGDLPDGFYVADDGPGIPPDAREAVFEHGYSTRPDGTGLGLAIVREVADAHDWSVSLVDDSDGARVAVTGVGPGAVEDDLTGAGRSD